MLHGHSIWLKIPFLLILAAQQAYVTALIIIIELLAIIFLLAGVAAYFFRKNIQSRSPSLQHVTGHRSFVPPIIVLTVPLLVLFIVSGTTIMGFTSRIISKPIPVPTPIATSKPISLVPAPQDLVSPGVLTVGTDPSYPIETYRDPTNGLPVGFDIELATNIAKLMSLKVKFKLTHFQNILNNLNNGMFDIVISAYPLTESIQGSTQFIPYLAPKDVLLALNGNPHQVRLNKLTDLCTHTIGVQSGSSEYADLRKLDCTQPSGRVIIDKQPDADTLMNELLNNRIDAIYQSSPTVSYYQQKYPGKFESVGKRTISQEGILIRSEDNEMYQAVKNAYTLLMKNGSYQTFLQQWGLTDDDITAVTSTPTPPASTPSIPSPPISTPTSSTPP